MESALARVAIFVGSTRSTPAQGWEEAGDRACSFSTLSNLFREGGSKRSILIDMYPAYSPREPFAARSETCRHLHLESSLDAWNWRSLSCVRNNSGTGKTRCERETDATCRVCRWRNSRPMTCAAKKPRQCLINLGFYDTR